MGSRGPQPRSGLLFRGRPVVIRGGYPTIRWPGHPVARGGLVSIPHLLAAEQLGRVLLPTECVRFADGNPWNWAPGNILITARGRWSTRAQRGRRRR